MIAILSLGMRSRNELGHGMGYGNETTAYYNTCILVHTLPPRASLAAVSPHEGIGESRQTLVFVSSPAPPRWGEGEESSEY